MKRFAAAVCAASVLGRTLGPLIGFVVSIFGESRDLHCIAATAAISIMVAHGIRRTGLPPWTRQRPQYAIGLSENCASAKQKNNQRVGTRPLHNPSSNSLYQALLRLSRTAGLLRAPLNLPGELWSLCRRQDRNPALSKEANPTRLEFSVRPQKKPMKQKKFLTLAERVVYSVAIDSH